MKFSLAPVALTLLSLAAPAPAEELKPLSAQDKARMEQLLQGFDPATYEFRFQWVDAKGKLQNARLGRAVGLGSVQQGATTKVSPEQAGHPQANAVVRPRSLGAMQLVNCFKADPHIIATNTSAALKLKLEELDALLRKYTR